VIKKYKIRTRFKLRLSLAMKELNWYQSLVRKKINSYRKPKIKLVAIAKNEACYLPEWIAHHLYFGFDSIDIYVNNTSDNTENIAAKLKSIKNVEFHNGDTFFRPKVDVPQVEIYKFELNLSKEQRYTHVMFLDIDEFWTPLNLTSSIHEFIKKFSADIVCFEWMNRTNEPVPYLPTISESLTGIKGNHIKSLVGTHVMVESVNPHNVLAYKANYQLADGSDFVVDSKNYAKINTEQVNTPIKDALIIHRMYRSQEEYVALLARGRPIQNRKFADIVKTNRSGYSPKHISARLAFSGEALERYNQNHSFFIEKYNLDCEMAEAKAFVKAKKEEMIALIENAPIEYYPILNKMLHRVTLQDVNRAMEKFKSKHQLS